MGSETNKKNRLDYLFDIDFKKYYLILSQQKSFIVIFCLSAMLTSLGLTYVFSEKYIAGTNIYYRPIETNLIQMKATQAFGSPAPAPPFRVIIQTLRDIAKSDAILLPIVKKLHLDQTVKRPPSTWYKDLFNTYKDKAKENALKLWSILKYGRVIEVDPKRKAIQELQKNFELTATKESYVYIATVKDKSAERAAILVDEIAAALVIWLKKQDVDPAADRILHIKEQLTEKEEYLKGLREQQANILNENNIGEVSEELSLTVANFHQLEKEYIQNQAELAKNLAMIKSYERILNQKSGLKTPSDLTRIKSELIFGKVNQKGLRSKNESLTSSMAGLEKRKLKMLTTKNQIEALNLQIQADTREYNHLKDMYLENFSQVSIGDSEVEIMHSSAIPVKPVQPIKIYHVGITGFLGIFFSAGLIYIFAFFNIRIFFVSLGIKGRRPKMES